ncbi:MAG: type II secretion system protein N [Steroidobacteraceae bacterium]|nr:type II secretion system protein N [Steroidobacteraceae bacterium]
MSARPDTRSGRSGWFWAALVVIALLVTLVVRWPLAWATRWLPAATHCEAPSGSVWHGRCASLAVGQHALGSVSWQLRPLRLLSGGLAADVDARQLGDVLSGRIELRAGGRIVARDLDARLTLGGGLLGSNQMGLRGTLHARLGQLALSGRVVDDIAGTVTVQDLVQGSGRATALGNYEITFTADAPRRGALRDVGGPLGVTGTLTLTDEPGYVVEGLVAPRADAPEVLVRQISFLGTPDAHGQRPFSVAGTY